MPTGDPRLFIPLSSEPACDARHRTSVAEALLRIERRRSDRHRAAAAGAYAAQRRDGATPSGQTDEPGPDVRLESGTSPGNPLRCRYSIRARSPFTDAVGRPFQPAT